MIHLDNRACFLWAFFLLILPADWLLSAFFAACIHEVSHIAAIALLGGSVNSLALEPFGAVIHAEGIDGWKEILSAVAGPLGSFFSVLVIRQFPVFGLCALVQGAYNLLPVYPLDGGRILYGILRQLCPNEAEIVGRTVSAAAGIALLGGSFWIAAAYSWKCWPILLCFAAMLRSALRKKP